MPKKHDSRSGSRARHNTGDRAGPRRSGHDRGSKKPENENGNGNGHDDNKDNVGNNGGNGGGDGDDDDNDPNDQSNNSSSESGDSFDYRGNFNLRESRKRTKSK